MLSVVNAPWHPWPDDGVHLTSRHVATLRGGVQEACAQYHNCTMDVTGRVTCWVGWRRHQQHHVLRAHHLQDHQPRQRRAAKHGHHGRHQCGRHLHLRRGRRQVRAQGALHACPADNAVLKRWCNKLAFDSRGQNLRDATSHCQRLTQQMLSSWESSAAMSWRCRAHGKRLGRCKHVGVV